MLDRGVWLLRGNPPLIIVWKGPGFYGLARTPKRWHILHLASSWKQLRELLQSHPSWTEGVERLGYHSHLWLGPLSLAETLHRLGYNKQTFLSKLVKMLRCLT